MGGMQLEELGSRTQSMFESKVCIHFRVAMPSRGTWRRRRWVTGQRSCSKEAGKERWKEWEGELVEGRRGQGAACGREML